MSLAVARPPAVAKAMFVLGCDTTFIGDMDGEAVLTDTRV